MRKNLKRIILFLIFVTSILINTASAQSFREFKGIGYETLDYEKASGFEVNNSSYLLLDSIVNECKSNIKIKTNYSYEDVNKILETIGSTIEKYNVVYDRFDLYSKALENRKLDCKFFTFTYLTVGENLSLPLYSMVAPEHVFVYWKDNSNEIYWEATCHQKRSRQFYIDSLKTSEQSISSLVYLNAIDNKHVGFIYYNYCGVVKSIQGDKKGALDDFNKSIELYSKYFEAFNNRGAVKRTLGDNKGALVDCNTAIELDPNMDKAYGNRGSVKYILGDNKGALDDLNKAIEINPDFQGYYVNRSAIRSAIGDNEGSIVDNKKAQEISSRSKLGKPILGNTDVLYQNQQDAILHFNQGLDKFKTGDILGSIADFNKAIEFNPKFEKSYISLGNAKSKLGDKQGAINEYTKAIELNPNNENAHNGRGNTKSDLGDKQGAINDYTKAIELNPKFENAYKNRGGLKSDLGDRQGAIDDFNKAIEINPKSAWTYFSRGNAKYELGDKSGACSDWAKAKELGSTEVISNITNFCK